MMSNLTTVFDVSGILVGSRTTNEKEAPKGGTYGDEARERIPGFADRGRGSIVGKRERGVSPLDLRDVFCDRSGQEGSSETGPDGSSAGADD